MSNKPKSKMPTEEEIKSWQKIPFKIIHVSSEDENHSIKELLNHTPFSRGWISAKFCNYPQEILLEFPNPIKMREIQFLSHQFNIASKIEIFIKTPGSDKFKKIGYLSLDNNERSNFQARELKTVYMNYTCTQIKLNLHKNHTNTKNLYSQVGLIALSILGENKKNEDLGNDLRLEDEMIYDPATLKRLKDLYKAKYKAVELEDFDEAKKIKTAIDSLKNVSQQLMKLEEKKKLAIKNDDFDQAKLIKNEIDRIRNAVAGGKYVEPVQQQNAPMQQSFNNNYMEDNKQNENNYENTNKMFMNNNMSNNMNNNMNNNMYLNNNNNLNIMNSNNEFETSVDRQRVGNTKTFEEMLNEQMNKNPQIPNNSNPKSRPNNTYNNNNINNNMNNQFSGGQKKPIQNIDNLHVGNNKNFNEMLEEQLQNEGNYQNNQTNNQTNNLPPEVLKIAEPIIPILSSQIVQLIFSKNWNNVKEGFNQLTEHINLYPNDNILGNNSEDNIINAVFSACNYVLNGTITQSIASSIEMIQILINKFNGSFKNIIRTDFEKNLQTCIKLIINQLGDNKNKEKSENILINFGEIFGNKILFDNLLNTSNIKKSLANSPKFLIGKYNVLTNLIDKYGYNKNEVNLDNIMNFAIKGYTNPQNTVRESALNLIVSLYKYVGDKVKNYFSSLRPAQIKSIEETLSQLNTNNMDNNEMVNNSQMLNKEMQNQYNNENIQKDDNNEDVEHTCQFCNYYDPNITQEQMEFHQFKDCPMLIACFKCKQIVEISGLNEHFLNECDFKNDFKLCAKCREPVLNEDYENHINSNKCNKYQDDKLYIRCPLCHKDFQPIGKVGWEVHLLQQTCPNNPRMNN